MVGKLRELFCMKFADSNNFRFLLAILFGNMKISFFYLNYAEVERNEDFSDQAKIMMDSQDVNFERLIEEIKGFFSIFAFLLISFSKRKYFGL